MKKNKIIPFSLLFITLTFLELFCIVKYSDVFYFPLAVGITLLGSAYLLLIEAKAAIVSFIKERDEKANEANTFDASDEKEEAAKLAKATYVLEKRILNLLEERILMPEENIENLSGLQGEIVRAIKASIKYERDNANHLADVISDNAVAPDNSMSPADLSQILAKFDTLALELKNNELTMGAVKEQLQTITDIARQISNNRAQYVSQPAADNVTTDNVPVSESPVPSYSEAVNEEEFNEPVSEEPLYNEKTAIEPIAEEATPEIEEIITASESTGDADDMPEFVDTLTKSESVATEDPNKKMSPEDIAALFAASSPEPEMAPAPAAAEDPNKKMSPEDIAALFAASNLELEPEPDAPAPKTAIEALSKPDVTPVSDDPNKKMSPEDIAALFASAGQ